MNNERSSSSLSRKNSRSCCGEKGHEKFFWVPKESFEFVHKFKEGLQGQTLTNDLIESILFEVFLMTYHFCLKKIAKLNKIWVSKENKMKNNYEKEIAKVKRHYSSMISSGDVQAKKTISRLQSQLKSIKENNKENVLESKGMFFTIDENKKSEENDKEKQEIIKTLKNRIEDLEIEKNESVYDKTVYIEGSYWMRNKFKL